jgi:hypothetical protein
VTALRRDTASNPMVFFFRIPYKIWMSCALLFAASYSTVYHVSLILVLSRGLSSTSYKIHSSGDFCKVISMVQKIKQNRVPKKKN